MLVTEMPTVGKEHSEKILSSVHILPDTDTAIVVLTNSLAIEAALTGSDNFCWKQYWVILIKMTIKLAEESVTAYKSM